MMHLRFQKTNRWLFLLTRALGVCLVGAWILYLSFGHQMISSLHSGGVAWLSDSLMQGRTTTPLERYYKVADQKLITWSIRVVLSWVVLLVVIKWPSKVMLACLSALFSTFLLFGLFELSPSLVKPLYLHTIPYYNFNYFYLPDDVSVYKRKPFQQIISFPNFRGDLYSPAYGLSVPPIKSVDWVTDEDGFRNNPPKPFSDVVVVGDSYLEDAIDDADAFPQRLEKHLDGVTVANLGVGGYGPIQYVEVLKRYGIKRKPKYALIVFFEGNDVDNTRTYLFWKEGKPGGNSYARVYDALSAETVLQKYRVAVEQTVTYVRERLWKQIWLAAEVASRRRKADNSVHPDVAVVNLGDYSFRAVLPITETNLRSVHEMLETNEWRVIRDMLREFRDLAAAKHIVPVIVFVPTAATVYAPHSTAASGKNWLEIRDRKIATRRNTETVVRQFANELNIEFISLIPRFDLAAEGGKFLYYPLDSHWNSEGRELAASFVAQRLTDRLIHSASTLNP